MGDSVKWFVYCQKPGIQNVLGDYVERKLLNFEGIFIIFVDVTLQISLITLATNVAFDGQQAYLNLHSLPEFLHKPCGHS
jgi:hypothetical protein